MTPLQSLSVTTVQVGQWCVYAHVLAGEVVYVGKGTYERPFFYRDRSQRWRDRMNAVSSFDIAILGWFSSEADALKAESTLIGRYRPELNCSGVPGRFQQFWHESQQRPDHVMLHVRFKHSTIVRVDARARREGIPRTEMMRRILAEQLVREEGLDRALGV